MEKTFIFTENDLLHYANMYNEKYHRHAASCFDKTTGVFTTDNHGHFERIIENNIVEYLIDNTKDNSLCREVDLNEIIDEDKFTSDIDGELKEFIHRLFYYNYAVVNINYHRIDEQKFLFINIIPSDPQCINMSINMTISWYKDRGRTEIMHFNGRPMQIKEFAICVTLIQCAIPELDMFSY